MDVFMENLGTADEGSIDIYPLVRRLTLDNISRAAFSVATDVQKDAFGPTPKFQSAAERSIDLWGSLWLSTLAREYLQFHIAVNEQRSILSAPSDRSVRILQNVSGLWVNLYSKG